MPTAPRPAPTETDETSAATDETLFEPLHGLPQLLLTSDQTLPNLLSLRELEASGFVLLYTHEKQPDRLRSICASFGFRELAEPIRVEALDDRRTELAVREGFQRLRAMYPEKSWVLNTTGGTKLACLGATRALGAPDANVPGLAGTIYYDGGLRSTAPGWQRTAVRPLRQPFGVADLLKANGILPHDKASSPPPGIGYTFTLSPAPTAEDRAVARAIASDIDGPKKIGQMRRGLNISTADAGKLAGRYAPGPHGQGYLFKSPADYFNGKWLECFLFDVLDRHRASATLPVDDLQMEVKLQRPPSAGRTTRPGDTETDLDICWSSRNFFTFVSCKSGAVSELQDEVFEVHARRNHAGGTFGGGALFHVHESDRLGSGQNHLERARRTAELLRVTLLDGNLLRDEEALLRALSRIQRR